MELEDFLFKSVKADPKDETAINAKLLIKGGFIQKLMAGVYSFLPLGFKVKEKVIQVIRQEMNAIGSKEILMPALHPKYIWDITGRWDTLKSIMYQFQDNYHKDYGLGPTHEEIVTEIAKTFIQSYSDLPLAFYQIQTKFRNEPRAKSGLIRLREFTMKDLYSFHSNENSLDEFYNIVMRSYFSIFKKLELKVYLTQASGGNFSKNYSHEFQVLSESGEDKLLICEECGFAVNQEININKCPQCGSKKLRQEKGIEVGNIFKLGTKFSSAMSLTFKDKNGIANPVIMASYGIGIERLIGTIVEIHHDDKGIIWPDIIAPFKAHLIILNPDEKLQKFGDLVYTNLVKNNIEVLYDKKERSNGEKLVDADLIGIPYRLVISPKTLAKNKIEMKKRKQKVAQLYSLNNLIKILK
ncbi:MAG: aminoacyl--tRNA ligase-related protein [Minisyncoccia bacterium]